MLSVFPSLLFLAPFSAFFIRIALALVFVHAGRNHFARAENSLRLLAIAEFLLAVALAAGAWTQIAVLAGACIIFFWLVRPEARPAARGTALLALVMCLSLLVTGGGALAFDLPL
ncbi:MAG TPA: hypothetical protein VJ043_02800 [Candidatus Paceibacterota bacterium]|nr:hypothetical protein [Candidatus Paceibacterota bacterium]